MTKKIKSGFMEDERFFEKAAGTLYIRFKKSSTMTTTSLQRQKVE